TPDSSASQTAGWRLAAAVPEVQTIATRECEVRDGVLHLPDGPGLGVEIDAAALERHRFH
ncbi:MAG: hypothetical protein ABWY90_08420, partial [Solirubrobacterales bacterium]